jgi:subtilisin family serine protease
VGSRRPLAAPLAALLAAIVLGPLAAVPGGPFAIDPAWAAAPDGRLVVTWRDPAPANLDLAGIAQVQHSRANAHRSVVVTRSGRTSEVAQRLRDDPRVASVVPDAVGTVAEWPLDAPPDDALYATYQADMLRIGMPGAWAQSTGSPDVVVAVLDTGYEGAHPDLAEIPTVHPYNARTGTQSVTDGYGHGTHVAGTIAAQTNNVIGVAGMAPDVTIMPVKVMDSNGQGYWSDFLEGVDWARTHGASIVNLSLGGPLSASQVAAFQPTFDAAWGAGTLVIAAAGNNDNSNAFYPASFAHVISVAATNNNDQKASFSNYGPKVDLSAPGVSIASTYTDATYRTMSGTSMATPHVVGLAALIRSAHPTYTLTEVETAMVSTAKDLGVAGRDDIFGYGRIEASAALAWSPVDVIPPVASLASPANGATNVSETIHPIVRFSEDVAGADGATIALTTATGTPIAATVGYDAATRRATIAPATRLASRTSYVVAVSPGIEDAAGNPLAPTSFTFTTGDTLAPTVGSTYPASGATGVWRGISPQVRFSEQVRNVSRDTIRLRNLRTGNLVTVRVTYNSSTHVATIDPTYRLMAGTWYQIKVRDPIEDAAGNNVGTRWFSFKTRS